MDTPEFSSYSRTGVFDGRYQGADTSKMTAEADRQTLDTLCQPPACTVQTSQLEMYHDLAERLAKVEKEICKNRVWSNSVDNRLQLLESSQRPLSGDVTQKELREKEEVKKLKEKIIELEARNNELLSKMMAMHKNSEDMNDPLRLSAVLEKYEMLKVHEWGKLRSSQTSCLTYKAGSSIIKKLFDACEKDVQQRTMKIFEVLDIPPSNYATTDSKQWIMQLIRNLLRCCCYQNHSEFYSKIIMEASIDFKTAMQKQFALRCCKTYCMLLLQDPPVEAVWDLEEVSIQYLEHVDKKDLEHWRKPSFLWPLMKCGEQVIVKGVVWD